MPITPNDISNKEFKKVLRGYDIDDVDEFLEEVVEEYEKVYRENITLKEKLGSLSDKIEHYKNIESTLQSTLLLAQTAADQAKENAKKDADLLLKDTQEQANEMVRKAKEDVIEVNKQYEMMKQEFTMFKSRFKSLIQAQLEAIDKSEFDNASGSATNTAIAQSTENTVDTENQTNDENVK